MSTYECRRCHTPINAGDGSMSPDPNYCVMCEDEFVADARDEEMAEYLERREMSEQEEREYE